MRIKFSPINMLDYIKKLIGGAGSFKSAGNVKDGIQSISLSGSPYWNNSQTLKQWWMHEKNQNSWPSQYPLGAYMPI